MKNGKKLISLMLALVMCLSMAACGGSNADVPEETPAEPEEVVEQLPDISGYTGSRIEEGWRDCEFQYQWGK